MLLRVLYDQIINNMAYVIRHLLDMIKIMNVIQEEKRNKNLRKIRYDWSIAGKNYKRVKKMKKKAA